MRITSRIFDDLAIIMIGLGVIVGVIFPFFSLILGVPQTIALQPIFIIACIMAGVLLGFMNITIARLIIRGPMHQLSSKMKHIQAVILDNRDRSSDDMCTAENCFIKVESLDEIGDSASAFNSLVTTLSEVMKTNAEINEFTQILTTYLDLEVLAEQTLNQLIKNAESSGGAILIEKNGEMDVVASMGIIDPQKLEINERILNVYKTRQRQIIEFPEDVLLDGVIANFQPKTLLLEPILYKNIVIGIIILSSSHSFSRNTIDKLSFFSQSLSLAFRNAITHNQIQKLAAIDELTGLYNRRFGSIRLQEEYGRSIRSDTPMSVLLFDIDHFKKVNDTYGHMLGDRVLVSVAKTASAAIREGDVLMRYGGEEFVCILPGASQNDAKHIAERIRVMVMDNTVKNGDQEIKITISIGIATFPNAQISNCEEFIKLADEAMYTAKETGRNRIVSN